jgi:transposase
MYVIIMTTMPPSKKQETEDSKTQSLREHHALNPHPGKVRDEAFQQHEFLDARDGVQVRYEMLRRHRLEGKSVSEVAKAFGMSRQAFYVTDAAFSEHGIPGLLPRRRGPKKAHKCTEEVLDFVQQWRPESKETLTDAIRRNFGVTINPRSIARAVARRKKKRARKEETQE